MKSIHFKSVIITGCIVGLVIMTSGMTMIPVVGDQMDAVLASRGLPPLSNWAMALIAGVSMCNGIFLVFMYAVLRPLLVSRIKTAFVSSLIVFFMTYFLSNVSLLIYGFMPVKLTVIGTVWGLGELLLAGVVGSKLYKEVKHHEIRVNDPC